MSNLAFGPFVLDPGSRTLTRGGERVPVTGKVLDTLLILVRNQGRLTTKEELLAAVWPDVVVEEANLTQSISTLRKILGDSAKNYRYVATVAGRGYTFVAPVAEVPDRPVAAPPGIGRRRVIAAAFTALVIPSLAYTVWAVRAKQTGPGAEQRILPFTAEPGVETMPAFSPDGKQIAFIKGGRQQNPWRGFWTEFFGPMNIFVKGLDNSDEIRLTGGPAQDAFPSWTPDGRYIAFVRQTSTGESGYYMIPAGGGQERRIGAAPGHSAGLAWFPDGRRLVVAEVSQTSRTGPLFVLSADTGYRELLTSPGAEFDFFPAFSPDGKWLAFVRGVDYSHSDIYMMPAGSGAVRRLTWDGAWKRSIAWMPDGSEILVCSERLWRVPVDGRAPHEVPAGDRWISKVAVALRGERAAYVANAPFASLWQADLGGFDVAAAEFAASTRDQGDPQFSPDGRHVAFRSARSGGIEIWTADAGGGNLRRLTQFKIAGSPSWSPNGKQIVFDERGSGNPDVWVVGSGGGKPRRITTAPSEDAVPSWSHDGKWIYFGSDRSGDFQIWRVPPEGESPADPAIQVTFGGGFRPLESADGSYLYFSKGPTKPGLWRRATGDANAREEPVIDSFQPYCWWTVGPLGLVFFRRDGSSTSLLRSSLAGQGARELAEIRSNLDGHAPAITVSPDGKHVIYVRNNPDEADVMLIENFR